MATDIHALTFADLAKLEPRLQALYTEAKNYPRRDGYSPTTVWYEEFKPRMEGLVGFYIRQQDTILRTSVAYDIAYRTILWALPPGREGKS